MKEDSETDFNMVAYTKEDSETDFNMVEAKCTSQESLRIQIALNVSNCPRLNSGHIKNCACT
jgi:hypothetical protein